MKSEMRSRVKNSEAHIGIIIRPGVYRRGLLIENLNKLHLTGSGLTKLLPSSAHAWQRMGDGFFGEPYNLKFQMPRVEHEASACSLFAFVRSQVSARLRKVPARFQLDHAYEHL
jgi:hypothetical protein